MTSVQHGLTMGMSLFLTLTLTLLTPTLTLTQPYPNCLRASPPFFCVSVNVNV